MPHVAPTNRLRNMRVKPKNPRANYNNYAAAMNLSSYGKPAMMGDLFGDIMGAVVGKDNWDARPDWMKSIKINPDPVKIATAAAKIVSPSQAGKLVDTAAQYGVNLAYSTPAGQIPITGSLVAGGYQNLPIIGSMMQGISSIPTWVYIVGAGAVLALVVAAKR